MAADQWDWWRNALAGQTDPIQEGHPQSGFYRHYVGVPVAIWRDDAGALTVLVGEDEIEETVKQGRVWLQVAKSPVTKAVYDAKVATGEWPDSAPEAKAPETKTEKLETTEQTPGPGDNSRDLNEYERMRAEVLGDVAEANAYYAKNKITDKPGADKAMDWGIRLIKSAKAADDARKRENEPLRIQIAENDAKWASIITEADRVGKHLDGLARAWGSAESERLRKEAEAKARTEWEAQQEELRKRREAEAAENARLMAERAASGQHDADGVIAEEPVATKVEELPLAPPAMIVEAPKLMLGSGASGNRKSVTAGSVKKEPAIVDLAAAAAFLAETKNADLIALVLRVGGKVAKAGGTFPGVQMRDMEAA